MTIELGYYDLILITLNQFFRIIFSKKDIFNLFLCNLIVNSAKSVEFSENFQIKLDDHRRILYTGGSKDSSKIKLTYKFLKKL